MSHHETTATPVWADKPIWTDLSTTDPAAARAFYAQVFGWQIDVNPDPLYGGYALATVDGGMVAGIGPKQMAEQPNAWALYIGTPDIDALSAKVQAAGGTVIVPGMDVGDQGRTAVYQDPSGAFIGAWQPMAMTGFAGTGSGSYRWAELNARGFDHAVPFYGSVFGWTSKGTPMGEGQADYHRFSSGGEEVAGGMEMSPMVPAMVPSYWMVYFAVADVDAAFQRAIDAGATEMVSPSPFPGGRFAIISDPQGAVLGLHQAMAPA